MRVGATPSTVICEADAYPHTHAGEEWAVDTGESLAH